MKLMKPYGWLLVGLALASGVYVIVSFIRTNTTGILVESGTAGDLRDLPWASTRLEGLPDIRQIRFTVRSFHRYMEVRFTAVVANDAVQKALVDHPEWREDSSPDRSLPWGFEAVFREFDSDVPSREAADRRLIYCPSEQGQFLSLAYVPTSERPFGLFRLDHSLKGQRIEALKQQYIHYAQTHRQGIKKGDHRIANKAYDQLVGSYRELRALGKGGTDVLKELMDHEDDSVRAWAATHSLRTDTSKAVQTLKDVAKGPGMTAFSARMVLEEWEKGTFVMPE